eukprot:3400732-Pyramimonas_sp.AAC.1
MLVCRGAAMCIRDGQTDGVDKLKMDAKTLKVQIPARLMAKLMAMQGDEGEPAKKKSKTDGNSVISCEDGNSVISGEGGSVMSGRGGKTTNVSIGESREADDSGEAVDVGDADSVILEGPPASS